MRSFKKILIQATAMTIALLYSNNVFAQNYVMKTAFVSTPGLKNFIVEKIFDETQTVREDTSNICGIRLTTPRDAVLYRFRNTVLDKDKLEITTASECDIIFMIVDFSSSKTNLRYILTEGVNDVFRISQGNSKIIIIAMNTESLPESDLKRFDIARGAYGKDNFDYILTSFDEDDEIFRNKFFEATDRMIDWRMLPASVESSERIIHRLIWLRALVSKEFDKDALIRELIRQDNARIAVEQRTETFEQDMSVTKEKLKDLERRTEDVEKVAKELKITVEELDSIRDLQSRLNGLTQALGKLSTLLQGISAGRPFNGAEAQHICDRIEANLRNFDTDGENSSTDRENPKDEMEKLRNHIRELRKVVAENRTAINVQEQLLKKFQIYMDEETEAQKKLLADRTTWLQKAAKIQHFVDEIKKDEEYIRAICEGKIKEFDWEQYKKCVWFGKWLTRTTRPYIKERAKREKLLEKQKRIEEELKKPKTSEKESDEGKKPKKD